MDEINMDEINNLARFQISGSLGPWIFERPQIYRTEFVLEFSIIEPKAKIIVKDHLKPFKLV